MADRAGWGEAKTKIVKWCDDYLAKNGRVPTWNEVKEGTAEGSANLSRSFTCWKKGIEVDLQSATSASPPAETIPLPASIITAMEIAWSTEATSERAAFQAANDAICLATKGNLEKLHSRVQELEQINNDVISEAETAAEKREQEITSAIAQRDAEIAALRRENERLARTLAEKERDCAEVSGKASQLAEEVTAAVRRAEKTEAKAEQRVNAARADATSAITRADAVANDAKERADQAVADAENSMLVASEAQIRAARLEADLKRVTTERDHLRRSQGAHIKREAMGAARNPGLPGKISVGRHR